MEKNDPKSSQCTLCFPNHVTRNMISRHFLINIILPDCFHLNELVFFLFLHLMEKNFKVKDTLVLEEAVLKGQMDSHGVFLLF